MAPMDRPPPLADRPPFPAGHDDARAELEAVLLGSPMVRTLGIRLLGWGPGWAQLSLRADASLTNLAGSVHGGATFALADAAFEIACNSHGRLAVALETTCHYHAPAPVGVDLVADAWEVALGGRTATYRLQVAGPEGQLLTSYLALAYRTSRWHVDPARLPEGWGS